MVDYWVDFISSGEPSILSGDWKPIGNEHIYLNVSGIHPSMDSSTTLHERMALWEEIMNNKVTTSSETPTDVTTEGSTISPTIAPTKDPTSLPTNTPVVTTNSKTSTDVTTDDTTQGSTTNTPDSSATKPTSTLIVPSIFFSAIAGCLQLL